MGCVENSLSEIGENGGLDKGRVSWQTVWLSNGWRAHRAHADEGVVPLETGEGAGVSS